MLEYKLQLTEFVLDPDIYRTTATKLNGSLGKSPVDLDALLLSVALDICRQVIVAKGSSSSQKQKQPPNCCIQRAAVQEGLVEDRVGCCDPNEPGVMVEG